MTKGLIATERTQVQVPNNALQSSIHPFGSHGGNGGGGGGHQGPPPGKLPAHAGHNGGGPGGPPQAKAPDGNAKKSGAKKLFGKLGF